MEERGSYNISNFKTPTSFWKDAAEAWVDIHNQVKGDHCWRDDPVDMLYQPSFYHEHSYGINYIHHFLKEYRSQMNIWNQ
ncbi:hypothetical protein RRG08_027416 [Elysia crispata]|uniref:Uncharacterized protein n=1 Tax=Elysia crispata TaxID=231223 RepID=A0AAE1CXR0_9GAST|nr:hypothetical protein RRG08_027416 [Elysia crispata]